jgi:hypothetical protein
MKTNFYYKENFPLEIRFTLENIEELGLFLALFHNLTNGNEDTDSVKAKIDVYERLRSWDSYMKSLSKSFKWKENYLYDGLEINDLLEFYKQLAEVYRDHESRDVLPGDIPEGTENSN